MPCNYVIGHANLTTYIDNCSNHGLKNLNSKILLAIRFYLFSIQLLL